MFGFMSGVGDNAGTFITILIVLVLILFLWVAVLFRQWSLLRKKIAILRKESTGDSMVDLVSNHMTAVKELSGRVDELFRRDERNMQLFSTTVRKVGVVRFDAFEEMGGQLSFAIALIDEDGNGFTLSSICGRNETRIYAKPLSKFESQYLLSEEEKEAVDRAIRSKRGLPVESTPPIIFERESENRSIFGDFEEDETRNMFDKNSQIMD